MRGAGAGFDAEMAASRASAFVYGNILVLAALLALSPSRVDTVAGVAYMVGTGFSTLVAHSVGEVVGDRIRHGTDPSWSRLRRHLRDSAPIASSAAVPAVLLMLAWVDLLPDAWALLAAEVVTIGRLAFLGAVIGHYNGRRSGGAIVSGLVLALVCATAAGLKWWLTH